MEISVNHALRTARNARVTLNALNARMASSSMPSPADPNVQRAPSTSMASASSVPFPVVSVLLLMFVILVRVQESTSMETVLRNVLMEHSLPMGVVGFAATRVRNVKGHQQPALGACLASS